MRYRSSLSTVRLSPRVIIVLTITAIQASAGISILRMLISMVYDASVTRESMAERALQDEYGYANRTDHRNRWPARHDNRADSADSA